MKLRRKTYLCLSLALVMAASISAASPAPPVFVKTHDSDEWVTRTFHIQKRYQRVLLVQAGGQTPQTVRIADLDLNSNNALNQTKRSYSVTKVFSTLQEAADAARGGDLVAVMPGTYAGFVLGDRADAADSRYVVFKAMGRPGEVTINQAAERAPEWMVYMQAAHHVVVEGFNI